MHFVLLLIHSSKVKYKIPNLYRPKKILMDSGKFLRSGLYVTLSQPVLNTSPLSRTVRDGMESMFYKYFILDCSVCHFHLRQFVKDPGHAWNCYDETDGLCIVNCPLHQ